MFAQFNLVVRLPIVVDQLVSSSVVSVFDYLSLFVPLLGLMMLDPRPPCCVGASFLCSSHLCSAGGFPLRGAVVGAGRTAVVAQRRTELEKFRLGDSYFARLLRRVVCFPLFPCSVKRCS